MIKKFAALRALFRKNSNYATIISFFDDLKIEKSFLENEVDQKGLTPTMSEWTRDSKKL